MQETNEKYVFNGSPKIGKGEKKHHNQKNRGYVLKLTIENHKGLEMLSVEALVRDWATIPPPPAPLSFPTTSHCRKLYLFDS